MDLSTGSPSADFRRYFMSQICWEIGVTETIDVPSAVQTRQKFKGLGSLGALAQLEFTWGVNPRSTQCSWFVFSVFSTGSHRESR